MMTEENTVRFSVRINAHNTVDSFNVKCVYDNKEQHRLDIAQNLDK